MSDYKPNALTNQSEAGTPDTSGYGNALRGALSRGLNDTLRTDTTAQTFLYRGFYGYVSSAPAKMIPVVGRSGGYSGELPLAEQPYLEKPRPWKNER